MEDQVIDHDYVIGINTRAELSKLYEKSAEVTELKTVAYYLASPKRGKKSDWITQTGKPIYALYRDDFVHDAQEIISGLVTWDLQYGLFVENLCSLKYKDSTEIKETEWENIRSVRIKIKTENEQDWEYTTAVRNRYDLNLRPHNLCASLRHCSAACD